jgi:hypothetical protein
MSGFSAECGASERAEIRKPITAPAYRAVAPRPPVPFAAAPTFLSTSPAAMVPQGQSSTLQRLHQVEKVTRAD